MLIALIWKFDFSPFMILVIAILNDGGFKLITRLRTIQIVHGTHHWQAERSMQLFCLLLMNANAGTIMTISKDRVRPSPHPDSWKLNEIFVTGVVYGTYLAVMTVIFFWAMRSTDFFTVS